MLTPRFLFQLGFCAWWLLANLSNADVFRWEFVDPADPAQGKRASAQLVPDGAGVVAVPGAILSNLDLTMAFLEGSNLSGSQVVDAVLANAALANANLSNADLADTSLAGADLRQATLWGAQLKGTVFTGAIIAGAEFGGLASEFDSLTESQLNSTASYHSKQLQGVRFYLEMIAWNLAGQDLRGSTFRRSLAGANLAQADLKDTAWGPGLVDVEATDLTGADVRGANLMTIGGQPILKNTIDVFGHVNGLDLTSSHTLLVRDDDGTDLRDPYTLTILKAFTMDPTGELKLRFQSNSWDSLITFEPGIPVELGGGVLRLDFAADVDVASQIGRTFRLFDWTGVALSGEFTVKSSHAWDLTSLYSTGEITLLAVPEPRALHFLFLASAALANLATSNIRLAGRR